MSRPDLPTCGDSGGITKDGRSCPTNQNLSATNGLCIVHDPERKGQLSRAGVEAGGPSAGGKAAARNRRIAKLEREARAGIKRDDLGDLATVEDAIRWTRVIGIGLADRNIHPDEANALMRVVAQWHKNEDLRLRRDDLRDLARQVSELRKSKGLS
jgi:hypothetical protein